MPKLVSKIVELPAPRSIVFKEEVLDSAVMNVNEVMAETLYSAISPGTEIGSYIGLPPLRPIKAYPRVNGYCNVAEVVAVGSDVTQYQVGDIVYTHQSHRSSFICTEDKVVFKIPKDSDYVAASVTYLYHLGYAALLRADFRPGCNVAVVGLGTLGITTSTLASLFGGTVFAFSNQDSVTNLAYKLGIKKVYKKEVHDGLREELMERTHGTGIDIVITTSILWEDWELAITIPRKGGTVCLLGFPGRGDPIPPFNPLGSEYFNTYHLKYIAAGFIADFDIEPVHLRFSLKRNCQFLFDLILDEKIHVKDIISSVESWDSIERVYQKIAERSSPMLTSVLKWK